MMTMKKQQRRTHKRAAPATSGAVHLRDGWRLSCGVTRLPGMPSSSHADKVTCEGCKAKIEQRRQLDMPKPAETPIGAPVSPGVFIPSTLVLKAKNDYLNTVLDEVYARLARAEGSDLIRERDYVKQLIIQTKS